MYDFLVFLPAIHFFLLIASFSALILGIRLHLAMRSKRTSLSFSLSNLKMFTSPTLQSWYQGVFKVWFDNYNKKRFCKSNFAFQCIFEFIPLLLCSSQPIMFLLPLLFSLLLQIIFKNKCNHLLMVLLLWTIFSCWWTIPFTMRNLKVMFLLHVLST